MKIPLIFPVHPRTMKNIENELKIEIIDKIKREFNLALIEIEDEDEDGVERDVDRVGDDPCPHRRSGVLMGLDQGVGNDRPEDSALRMGHRWQAMAHYGNGHCQLDEGHRAGVGTFRRRPNSTVVAR